MNVEREICGISVGIETNLEQIYFSKVIHPILTKVVQSSIAVVYCRMPFYLNVRSLNRKGL